MTTFAIIDNILLLLLTGLMGFLCGLFSYFLDYCFWPGSIFKFYLPWVAKNLVKSLRPEKYKETMLSSDPKAREENFLAEADHIFIFKMLGRCPTCFNIWIAMLSYTLICCFTALPWYFCFSYILVSSWNIRRLTGAVYN